MGLAAAQRTIETLGWLLTPRLTPYIPHVPEPKQTAFLLLDCEEAMYGGAAGGGKSDALLMAALQYVDIPGYAALVLRRTYKRLSLPEGLIPRSHDWLAGSDARWDEENKTWHFPSPATLTFGHMEHENDKYVYQGPSFQFIGFDELTEFSETQYRYMFSRKRRLEGFPVPTRIRAASNPGGIGHDWVKQRFLVEGRAHGRIFIPALLDDNPWLDREDYVRSLMHLDPVTRDQLLRGDWSARATGGIFRREWFEILDAAPRNIPTVRYWDLAATAEKPGTDPDWTAGCRMGRDSNGVAYVMDVRRIRGTPADIEALVQQSAVIDGPGTDVWMEQERGGAGANLIDHYRRRVLPSYSVRGDKVTGDKRTRAGPLSSQAEAGNVKLVRGDWIGAFLDELEAFPNGSHDDQVDAASGAYLRLASMATATNRVYGEVVYR